jgi:thiol-disulfide isomerase/thioredoxin
MFVQRKVCAAALVVAWGMSAGVAGRAQAADLAQALGFSPIQSAVEYTVPNKEESAQCTIRPEKDKNVSAWVVRNRQGEILRRFADTNGDNVVDLWCYYLNGLEVYRDVDSNFNHKADQYCWFHTAGTRWGIDENEDGRIDSWRVISAHEVAEQVVLALKGRDQGRFDLVLLTPAELANVGLGESRGARVAESLQAARAGFSKLLAEQRIVTPKSRFVDFGSARPARIPAGTAGSTKDVVVLDNATALVETDGKHEQVFLGTLVAVGETWKLVAVPVVGSDNQPEDGGFLLAPAAPAPGSVAAANMPNEEMQKLMTELEQLYRLAETLPADQQAANIEQRAEKLQRLAEISPEADRDQWYRQLAGMISVAIQSGSFPQGFERLDALQKTLTEAKASDDLLANVAFQRMWADYVISQRQPGAEAAKIQEKWLADLQAFVEQYPKSPDSAEALLQLGMYLEFVGKADEATKWYQQLVSNFPKADQAAKAAGGLRRLGSVGKAIRLRGADIQGGMIDLAGPPYRGKVVLIHYWATWCEPCKADMVLLKDLYAKRGGRDFDIIGVCLDDKELEARRYLSENRFPWKHIHEPGGLDSRLANEMGVMTLPLMLLVDQKGSVAHNNIHVGAELDGELGRLIPPTTGTANSSRNTTKRR